MQYENLNEHELFELYEKEKSDVLKECILKKYLYIAEIVAKKFVGRGVEYDDLFQVASLALVKAVDRFENMRGIKFSSFATPTLVGEIKNYFRDKTRMIRISRRDSELIRKMEDAKEVLRNEYGRKVKPEGHSDISGYRGRACARAYGNAECRHMLLRWILRYRTAKMSSLCASSGRRMMSFERVENRDFIKYCMTHLNDVEKQLVKYRYVYEKSQREVAVKLGVSQMYVSRVERKILEKLRNIYKNQV